jgi:hypothetical protein
MTDKEKLITLFNELGIQFTEEVNNTIICGVNSGEKIQGYFGFYVEFIFGENGNFLNMGIWE